MIDLLCADQFRDDHFFFQDESVLFEEVVGFCLGGGINKSATVVMGLDPVRFEGLVLTLRQVLGHWCHGCSGGCGGGGRRWVYWRQRRG